MPFLGVGGASRLMSEIIPLMNKEEDFDVDLLIGRNLNDTFMDKLKASGAMVYSLNFSQIYNPINILKIKPYLKNYDLIHVHLFPSLYWVAIANLFVNKPLIYTEHNTNNRRRGKWYYRIIDKWIYSKYKKIISISPSTESSLKSWLETNDKNKFVVVNNGINIIEFSNCKSEHIYPRTLINVARFAPEKDQETIIRTMKLLDNDIHLILLGEGDKMDKCKSLADELGVRERVHFMGSQPDVPKWLGKADIGIQSSMWEGFGLTAVEMMASGLPVIASEVEGLSQIVNGAGILFPRGDYKKLAEIINQLFIDKDYYNSVKEKCIERSKEYGIEKMANSYMKVYHNIKNIK